MSCSSCGGASRVAPTPVNDVHRKAVQAVQGDKGSVYTSPQVDNVVGKSTSTKKVQVRYYGGGYAQKRGTGCRSCGGGNGSYSVVTNETIMFVSEDAPGGLFKETFSVGHDYYVTEKQAEYLLSLQFRSRAGTMENKFRKVEE